MARKTHDIAAKVGEYTNSSGETKGRWLNVGALMQADDGGQFIILHRTFNPAGMPNPDGRDSVMLSCFVPNNDRQQSGGQQQASQQQSTGTGGAATRDIEDEIPFTPECRV